MKKNSLLIINVVALLLLSGTIESISGSSYPDAIIEIKTDNNCYGFIIEIDENQDYELQKNISISVNRILNGSFTVHWLCHNISVVSDDLSKENNTFERFFKKGCFILPFYKAYTDVKLASLIMDFNKTLDVPVFMLKEPLNNVEVYTLYEPVIGHMDRYGVDSFYYYQHLFFGGFLNHYFFSCDEIVNGELHEKCNVLAHGGQLATLLQTNLAILNPYTRKAYEKIKDFVTNGGGYIGSCMGSAMASEKVERPLELPVDLQYTRLGNLISVQMGLIDRSIYRALPGGNSHLELRSGLKGSGITVRIVDPDCPVSYGLPEIIENFEYLSGPMFLENKNIKSNSKDLAVIENIGDRENYSWDGMMHGCLIYNSKIIPEEIKQKRLDNWIEYGIGKPIWVTNEYGEGKVVVFGGHPEFYWAVSPPRIVYNAIFYLCSDGPFVIDIDAGKLFSFDQVSVDGPYEMNLSEEISFNKNSNLISQNGIWLWSFGDGTFAEGKNVTHSYDNYGKYPLALSMGNQDFLNVDFTTVNILGNLQAKAGHYNIIKNETIVLNADASGGFEPYIYGWDFDDGTVSNEINPEHSFDSVGVYNCNVLVTDRFNNTTSSFFSVVVNNIDYVEEHHIFTNSVEDRVNIGENINFTQYFYDPIHYEVNVSFDDGTYYKTNVSNVENITFNHSYSKPGIYYPTARLINEFGEEIIKDTMIYVNAPPNKSPRAVGDATSLSGRRYYFRYSSTDPDGDKVNIQFFFSSNNYESDILHNLTKTFLYDSGEIGIMYCNELLEGDYQIRVKGIDEYGAVAEEWSEPLEFTICKDNSIWKTPYIAGRKLVYKYPDRFPILEKILKKISSH